MTEIEYPGGLRMCREVGRKEKLQRSMKIFNYYNDFTAMRYYLFIGKAKALHKWERKMFGLVGDISSSTTACHHFFTEAYGAKAISVIWMPQMKFLIDEYVSLAHECLHAAISTMHRLDMNIIVGSDSEQLNYLHDAIYGNFLKQLHRDRKKEEKEQTSE